MWGVNASGVWIQGSRGYARVKGTPFTQACCNEAVALFVPGLASRCLDPRLYSFHGMLIKSLQWIHYSSGVGTLLFLLEALTWVGFVSAIVEASFLGGSHRSSLQHLEKSLERARVS